MWCVIFTSEDRAHVLPVDDLIDHDTSADDACVCMPTASQRLGGWKIVHHSLDGREHMEPDHDRDECPTCQSDPEAA